MEISDWDPEKIEMKTKKKTLDRFNMSLQKVLKIMLIKQNQ